MTERNHVTVLGAGVLGSQIAMQAAYAGKQVVVFDIAQDLLAALPQRWEWMRDYYARDLAEYTEAAFAAAIARICTSTDLAQAVGGADVVIESVAENLEIKRQVWETAGRAAPAHALLLTNTSTLRPSDFAEATGHPERFLTLHLANLVWKHNVGEVMRTPKTGEEAFQATIAFAAEINLHPVPIRKETPAYVLNNLLVAWLEAGIRLYVNEVADPADIDQDWRIATGSPRGPFEVLDVVGFNVLVNIFAAKQDPELDRFAALVRKFGLDRGRTGLASGEGFYRYDAHGGVTGVVEDWLLRSEG